MTVTVTWNTNTFPGWYPHFVLEGGIGVEGAAACASGPKRAKRDRVRSVWRQARNPHGQQPAEGNGQWRESKAQKRTLESFHGRGFAGEADAEAEANADSMQEQPANGC